MNMMQRGADMVARRLATHAPRPVIYQTATTTIDDVIATVGTTTTETMDRDGVTVRSTIRDYLIDADQLVSAGAAFEPRRNDVIIDDGQRYVVTPVGNDPPARWSGRNHSRWRIHTRHDGAAS